MHGGGGAGIGSMVWCGAGWARTPDVQYYSFVAEVVSLKFMTPPPPCRRRVEFGLLEEPSNVISDADLETVIREIREDAPYSGVQMMCGSLR